MRIINVYYSQTGNTEKIARKIDDTLCAMGHEVETLQAAKGMEIDFLKYDFVFAGSGVYQWLPGKPMLDMLRSHRQKYSDEGKMRPCSPRLPDKKAVIYCTYAGVHTGINEAVPAIKFTGQLFDHLGFVIVAEWYFMGDFKTEQMKHLNAVGRMGDITGRPDEHDLKDVEELVTAIIKV